MASELVSHIPRLQHERVAGECRSQEAPVTSRHPAMAENVARHHGSALANQEGKMGRQEEIH